MPMQQDPNRVILDLIKKAGQGLAGSGAVTDSPVGSSAELLRLIPGLADGVKSLANTGSQVSLPGIGGAIGSSGGQAVAEASPEEQAFQEGKIAAAKKAGAMAFNVDMGLEAPPEFGSGVVAQSMGKQLQGMKPQTGPEVKSMQAPTQPQQSKQSTQQQAPEGQKTFGNPLSNFLQTLITVGTGGIPTPGYVNTLKNIREGRLEQDLRFEKKKNELPLSEARREELAIQSANSIRLELEKAGMKGIDALTPEAAGKFNLIIDGSKATKQMAELIDLTDSDVLLSAPGFLKSQKGRQFESAMRRAFGAKLRLESGGAINESEINEQWKTFRPRKTDSEETIRQKLSSLNNFFEGTLNVADPTGTHRARAGLSGSILDKVPNEQIIAELRKRGVDANARPQ